MKKQCVQCVQIAMHAAMLLILHCGHLLFVWGVLCKHDDTLQHLTWLLTTFITFLPYF